MTLEKSETPTTSAQGVLEVCFAIETDELHGEGRVRHVEAREARAGGGVQEPGVIGIDLVERCSARPSDDVVHPVDRLEELERVAVARAVDVRPTLEDGDELPHDRGVLRRRLSAAEIGRLPRRQVGWEVPVDHLPGSVTLLQCGLEPRELTRCEVVAVDREELRGAGREAVELRREAPRPAVLRVQDFRRRATAVIPVVVAKRWIEWNTERAVLLVPQSLPARIDRTRDALGVEVVAQRYPEIERAMGLVALQRRRHLRLPRLQALAPTLLQRRVLGDLVEAEVAEGHHPHLPQPLGLRHREYRRRLPEKLGEQQRTFQ